MRKLLALICLTLPLHADPVKSITGAGATFPTPLYAKWAEGYKSKVGTEVNYQSIGSGGGIKQVEAKTVDFGATDKPLSEQDLEKKKLIQFPAVIGGLVLVVNIDGVTSVVNEPTKRVSNVPFLVLDGETIGEIFAGKITKWNDPKIVKLNPGINFPDAEIAPVHRADGSGTTYVFVSYLQKASTSWKDKKPDSTADWPTGVGAKGNEGVAGFVQNNKNTIGYVEYAYAKQNKLPYTALINKDGKRVEASIENFQAAASTIKWEEAKDYDLTDQPGEKVWPITDPTYILIHKDLLAERLESVKEVVKFFEWSFDNGTELAKQLDYVPLPESLIKKIKNDWQKNGMK